MSCKNCSARTDVNLRSVWQIAAVLSSFSPTWGFFSCLFLITLPDSFVLLNKHYYLEKHIQQFSTNICATQCILAWSGLLLAWKYIWEFGQIHFTISTITLQFGEIHLTISYKYMCNSVQAMLAWSGLLLAWKYICQA